MEKLYQDGRALEAYIQTPDKLGWYKMCFSKYDVNGVEKYAWSWSWYAFFFGPIYLAYRKCYLEAVGIWVLTTLFSCFIAVGGIVSLAISIAIGGSAPYLVYRRYKKMADQVEMTENNYERQLEMLRELGGVNTIARNIFIVIYGLVVLMGIFFGILAALLMNY